MSISYIIPFNGGLKRLMKCHSLNIRKKNNLSKNTCGDIKMYWKVYANEYTKLVYSNTFGIYFSFIYFVFASLAKAKYLTSETWSKLKQCIIENFST